MSVQGDSPELGARVGWGGHLCGRGGPGEDAGVLTEAAWHGIWPEEGGDIVRGVIFDSGCELYSFYPGPRRV